MANPLYNEMQNNNVMNQLNQFKQNPMQFLMQRNVNIPQQYANDPQSAVQYLLNSGKMSQQTLNNIMQVAGKMGFKL